MCILFIAIGQHPRYPLIIAANRDEYYARPSTTMHHWSQPPDILAGRDRRAGGTWFGVHPTGRIAAVANYRMPADPTDDPTDPADALLSRGELVLRYLSSPAAYTTFLHRDHHLFRPFNLLYGAPGQLRYFSSVGPIDRPLSDGFHGFSNGAIDDPWPKTRRGIALMKEWVAADGGVDALAEMMKDEVRPPDAELPSTGLPRAREQQLSSIFIRGEDYGTRTTTMLFAAADKFNLYEYNYRTGGAEVSRGYHWVGVPSADVVSNGG